MKIGVFLSVREKATRFPGKVLKVIHGRTVTEILASRLALASGIDAHVIATSDDPRDDVFDVLGAKVGYAVFHGSRADKLLRYRDACLAHGLDACIIVDGDDILCFPEYVAQAAARLRQGDCDVVFCRDLPLGAAASGLTLAALNKVIALKDEEDTEVWGGYFTKPGLFRVAYLDPFDPILAHPEVRMTLDYEEDLRFLEAVFDAMGPERHDFTSLELMDLLINRKPDIPALCAGAQEKFLSHIQKTAPVRFKDNP